VLPVKKKLENSLFLLKRLHDALLDCPEVAPLPLSESYRLTLDERLFDALVDDSDVVELNDAITDARQWQRFQQTYRSAPSVHDRVLEGLMRLRS
jgi:hypothetical protein